MDNSQQPSSLANRRTLVRRLSYSSILLALSIILTRVPFLTINLNNFLRVGFGSIPIVLASLICGPFWGFLVGAGSDLLGAFIAPAGDYFFGYTIDAALEGILPWLTMYLLKGRKKAEGIAYVALSAAAVIYSVAFASMFSVFKKQNLETWLRICIPVFTALFFAVFGLVILLLKKTKVFKGALREERRFSLGDIYLTSLVIGIFIGLFLKPVWNYMYVNIPYFYTAFADLLLFALEGTIKAFMTFFIINALFKADSTIKPYKLSVKEIESQKAD